MKKLLLLFVFLLSNYFGFAQADIKVINTNFQTKYTPNSEVIYTISIVNLGPSAATNINVSSLISNGISQKEWTGPAVVVAGVTTNSGGGGEINDIIPTLASGKTASYVMKLKVPLGYTGNLVCNVTANVAGDPNTANNSVTDTDSRATDADISVTNTNNQVVYTPGSTATYTVIVKNNGPLGAGGVTISNTIPAGITDYSWTGSNGSTGTNTPLNNTIGPMSVGKVVTYIITAQIPAGFVGNLTNTVTVASQTSDITAANNTATDVDVPNSGANLVVVNTDGVSTYKTGTQKVYTLTVKNNGPSAAVNVIVNNAIPAGITSFSWTGSNGSSGTNVPLNDTIASLANGTTITYTITLDIPNTFTGNLVSEASATSDTVDLYPECPQCIDIDTLQSAADIAITNTDNQITYIQGGTSIYKVTVTNNGSQAATNVVVNNAIPAGIIGFSWTGNGANGTNTALSNTILNLAPGQSIIYTITMQIPASFTGNLTSTATANSEVLDENTANNTATDTDTLGTGADIVVTNTNSQEYYTAGSNSIYTITVSNNGPLNAVNVAVNNPIPAGVTSSSWTGDNGSSGTNVDLVNTIPLLTVGSSVVYTFTIGVPATQTTNFVSTATATSATPDPNPNCEACTDTDLSPTGVADIVTVISDGSTWYRAGQAQTYTITITNNGPSSAQNVLVQGNVSSGINPATISWSGNGNPVTSGYLNTTIPTLANGASVTFTVYVPVPSNYNQNENLVTSVVVTSDTTDPTPNCFTCTDVDTPKPSADLVVYKTNNQEKFLLGEDAVYVITVRNNGVSDAVNVLVTDALPFGISGSNNMSWISSTGASGVGPLNETIPFLEVGEIIIYKVIVKVPLTFPLNTNLINNVTATSDTPDSNLNNNTNISDVDTPRGDFVTVDSTTYTTTQLIKDVLINEPCVQLSNFSSSAPISFGYFHRNNSDFPFKEGIIIRSGIAKNTEGKYTGNGTTSVGSNTSDADLQVVMNANGLTSQNKDASFVKFSFVPTIEDFSFNFLFASEEYGTYQCSSSFVDTFAFILTNTVTGVSENLAVVPGTTPPTLISVVKIKKAIFNTSCGDLNPQFFGRYNAANIGPAPVGPASSAINLKGQTTSMVASATVTPNTLYSIKLVIGDAGDTALDSAVFLEAGSFNIGGPKITGTGIYDAGDDFSGANAFCAGTSRILKAGTAPNPNVTYSWKKDDVLIAGATSYQLEVTESGIYTVIFSYGSNGCQQSDDIVVVFDPTDFPMEDAEDLYVCTPTFDLTANEPVVMANYNQGDFDTYYYTSLEAAQDPLFLNTIPASEVTAYTGTNGQEIWMRMVNIYTGGICDPIESFKLYNVTPPSGTFSYAEDGGPAGFCSGSSSILIPVAPDFPVGGTYSALPAGLTINSATGAIDLATSLVGNYTITYDYSGQGCSYTTDIQLEVIFCGDTIASNSGNVCQGTATFDLFATDAGTGATYEWKDYNNVVFSTNQNPVGVQVPSAPGSYIYSVVATLNGTSTDVATTTLIVYELPEAVFVSQDMTICTNTSATLLFEGLENSTVTITNGTNTYSVAIGADGTGTFTTPLLDNQTTYSIVDALSSTTPACTFTATPGSPNNAVTISVGLPTATIVGFTNPVICSGTSTGLEIQGTPNATVSYTIGGVAQPDVTLSASGSFIIPTGIQTVTTTTNYTYALTNVESNPAPPALSCSKVITGQSAVLTVNALPTATFTAADTSICEGTAATLNFSGTPNATVTYNDGTNTFTTTLDATGNKQVTTANLAADTTFTLVSVEVTNTVLCSNTATGSVTITMDENVAITTQPIGATICINTTATFTVVASGANLTYQWFKGGNAIASATSASYSVTNATAADAGNYTVVVSGACGTPVTSSTAPLVITQETIITTQPQAATTICVGQPINLSVTATGTNMTYQWFRGTTSLTGKTNPILNIASATTADAGTYTVVITNPCQVVTSANAVVIVNELPVIVTQPIGTTICEGQGISLSVSATGTNLTYQWFRNGTIAIPTATSSTYTDTNVTLAEAGNYTVIVSGACAPAVTSAVATIVVNQGATFTQQPVASTTVCSGTPIALTVATTGGTNVTYQWFKGSTAIAGATAPTYNIASSAVADSGNYTCVVTVASCGSKTSNVAVVTVNQAPAITTQPQNQNICVGQTATFTVVATGTNLTYKWYKGTTAIAGATSSTYTITNATQTDSGTYYCDISSLSCPNIQTTTVTLAVKPLPTATISQGNPSTICEGQSTQVIFNGTPGAVVIYTINGGTQETITLSLTGGDTILPTGILDETTVYDLVSVTYTGVDACSQTLTGSATVTVNPLPTVTLEDGFICIDPVTLATTRTYRLDTKLNEGEFTFAWFDENGPIANQTYTYYDVDTVGQYGVTITNIITGCQSSAFANVDSSSPPTDFTYTVSGFFASNPTVVISATPIGNYEYQLDYGPFQESNVFDNIAAGTHTITVRDPQACDVLTQNVLIIDYPKYFTPNGDGINDTWNIPTINTISMSKIYIFDRFGKLIKEMTASGSGWDGTYNGQDLPATDYWFTINYQEAGINKDFRAHFSLKR